MNRRQFFGILIGAYCSRFYKPAPIPGTYGAITRSKVAFWNPYPAQVEFMSRPLDTKWILHANNYGMSKTKMWAAPLRYAEMVENENHR